MVILKNVNDSSRIRNAIGPGYSGSERLKLRGTGSSKTVYIDGIEAFGPMRSKGQALDYVSFELFPNGLLGRYHKNTSTLGVALKREEIADIHFESFRILIPRRILWQYRPKIVHEALIQFQLRTGERLKFYVPATFYEPLKSFFRKGWLKQTTRFEINPADPRPAFESIDELVAGIREATNRLPDIGPPDNRNIFRNLFK